MRFTVLRFVVLSASLAIQAWSAEAKSAAAPKFVLAGAGDPASDSRFTPAQLAFVQSWIRQKAPECPVDVSAAVAQGFLAELAQRQPDKIDRLLAPDFPTRAYDSMLLRQVGVKLVGEAQTAVREKIAERRVAILLAADGRAATGAAALVAKMRDASSFQYRRLLEGRYEDDELQLQLRKVGQPAAATVASAPAAPKTLTAAEIVSEFARRNQVGTAMLKLQAYIAEGQLTTATGEVQQLVISKMRPDRVRVVVLSGGLTQYTIAADADRFWQQSAGAPPQFADGKGMGPRRYLAEFADPFFVGEGFAFERLPDGKEAGKPYYRIGVRRPDGSGYVAWVEPGTYRQIGRENEDKSIARYSDFREVAGVTFAFREDITDVQGRKGVLQLTRLLPNPGLLEAYFFPPGEPGLNYHQVEQFLVRPSVGFSRPVSPP
jgi:hypothetical protein